VVLNWNTATEGDFGHYEIYKKRDTDSGMTLLNGSVANADSATSNSYIHNVGTGNTDPGEWSYFMKDYDNAGNVSLQSRTFSVPAPDAPENLTAIAADTKAYLRWREVTEGFVKGYRVYRSTSSSTWTQVLSVDGRSTTTSLDNGPSPVA